MPKFLVIRLSSMGDIVLTTPVVRCLKQQVRDAGVHFLTRKEYLPLLEHNPYIDKVVAYGKRPSDTVQMLKAESYDAIIDLHHNLRTARLKRALGLPATAFRKLNVEKWLLVNLRIHRLPDIHIVERYLETVKHLGVVNDGQGLDFFAGPETALPVALPARYVAIVSGGRHATKMLPPDRIAAVVRALDAPAVLLGGGEDRIAAEAVVAAVGDTIAVPLVNACGLLTVSQSARVLHNAQAVITHDTGMMHIAAALGKRIVTVWGSTVPAFGMAPYFGQRGGEERRFEVKGLSCRPCSKIGFAECPRRHFRCMRDQDVRAIAAAAKDMMA